jgi:hypothetical protein
MTRRHESWICVISCKCADGRDVRVKLVTQFRHPCLIDQAQARARAVASELERELSGADSPESVIGREQQLARRLLRRAAAAHEILAVEVSFPERGGPASSASGGSGAMSSQAPVMSGSAASALEATDSGPISRRHESLAPATDPLPGTRSPAEPLRRAESLTPSTEPLRRPRALIVHGDMHLLTKVIEVLTEEFDVLTATGAQHGETVVQTTPFDVVIVAHPLRDGSGIALLKEATLRNPDTTCFVLSTRAGSKVASEAMREAHLMPRVLFEPLEPADVLAKARTVLTLTRMREAAAKLQGRRVAASDP